MSKVDVCCHKILFKNHILGFWVWSITYILIILIYLQTWANKTTTTRLKKALWQKYVFQKTRLNVYKAFAFIIRNINIEYHFVKVDQCPDFWVISWIHACSRLNQFFKEGFWMENQLTQSGSVDWFIDSTYSKKLQIWIQQL